MDGRPGNGQKVWASQFTGKADVAHNLAYLRGVAIGFTKAEVIAAAGKARDEAKKPKPTSPRWIENEYTIINVSDRGLILADQTTMPWVQAAKVAGKLRVEAGRKESLLEMMRLIYVRTSGARPQIARVGKAIAAL